MPAPTAPYDALLLLSFGGPERPEDVIPFLQNVTRGRGVPAERLAEVAQHYLRFGGRSPINDQNRALLAALRADFERHGLALPIYWGNRNWDPLLTDTMRRLAADGVRRVAVFATSAYASYSSCRQYRENLFDAAALVDDAPRVDLLRRSFNHPGFLAAFSDTTTDAVRRLPPAVQEDARLLFVTHSLPVAMAASSGPEGDAYVTQHRDAAAVVAGAARTRTRLELPHDLAFCSRSGPPQVAWLEPDVNERLREMAALGTRAVVVVPIGFVSDHMEVRFDLDTEAAATAAEAGLAFERAATPGVHPAFVAMVRELVLERAAAERGGPVDRPAGGELGACWDVCAAGCCSNPRGPRPALAEAT